MAAFIRISRTPDLVIATACFEHAGEIMRFSNSGGVGDWAYIHMNGRAVIKWPDDSLVPDWWLEKHLEVWGTPFVNADGMPIEPRGVLRFSASGEAMISSADPDTYGCCIVSLAREDVLRGVFGNTVADAVLGGPEWDGVWSQTLDWVSERQVDPRTLTKVVDGSTCLVDQEVLENNCYNDLLETFPEGNPGA